MEKDFFEEPQDVEEIDFIDEVRADNLIILADSLLKDYDAYSQRYLAIEKRVEELKGSIQRDSEDDIFIAVAPTLKELVSSYNLTLYSVDNYRKILREAWEIIYPKRHFPRA